MNTFKFRLIGTVDMIVTIEADDAETASALAYDYPSEKLKWVNWEVEEIEEEIPDDGDRVIVHELQATGVC